MSLAFVEYRSHFLLEVVELLLDPGICFAAERIENLQLFFENSKNLSCLFVGKSKFLLKQLRVLKDPFLGMMQPVEHHLLCHDQGSTATDNHAAQEKNKTQKNRWPSP